MIQQPLLDRQTILPTLHESTRGHFLAITR